MICTNRIIVATLKKSCSSHATLLYALIALLSCLQTIRVTLELVHSEQEYKELVWTQRSDIPQMEDKSKEEIKVEMKKTAKKAVINFSMCALVKDENNHLDEWIAYHYTTINLQHLVICDDVDSISSPHEVLEKWGNYISYEVWNVDKYAPPLIINGKSTYEHYQVRQKRCLMKCMQHFKATNKTWALFTDPDEFIAFNSVCNPPKQVSEEIPKLAKRLSLPRNLRFKTFLDIMEENPDAVSKPCSVLPRLQFTSRKEKNDKILDAEVPRGFNPKNFTTLSQFTHGLKVDRVENKKSKWVLGKSMIDVSQISTPLVRNAHMIHPK